MSFLEEIESMPETSITHWLSSKLDIVEIVHGFAWDCQNTTYYMYLFPSNGIKHETEIGIINKEKSKIVFSRIFEATLEQVKCIYLISKASNDFMDAVELLERFYNERHLGLVRKRM